MQHDHYDAYIDREGGAFSSKALPNFLPKKPFEDLQQVMSAATTLWFEQKKGIRHAEKIRFAFTASTSLSCSVNRVDHKAYLILVPVGLYARFCLLSRLLLQYWGKELKIGLANSALDVLDDDFYYIPESVAPVFIEYDDPKMFWRKAEECWESISIDDRTIGDIAELVSLIHYFVFYHELAHCAYDHFGFQQNVIAAGRAEVTGLSDQELYRGLELQADVFAAKTVIGFILGAMEAQYGEHAIERCPLSFLRLGYAYTMYMAATDTWRRKFLDDYREGRYCHPTIRHFAVVQSTAAALSKDERQHLIKLWNQWETDGWMRCLWAFNELSLRAYEKSQPATSGRNPGPLHSMLYGVGGPTMRVLEKMRAESIQLYQKIETIVEAYSAGKLV